MAKAQRIPEPARAVPSEPREQLQTASETEGKEREARKRSDRRGACVGAGVKISQIGPQDKEELCGTKES
jgi:hypothetical protein